MEARPLSTAASKLKSNRVSAQAHSALLTVIFSGSLGAAKSCCLAPLKEPYAAEHFVDHRLHEFKCQPQFATQVRKTGQLLIKVPIELLLFADFSSNFYLRAVLGHILYDELIPSLNGF